MRELFQQHLESINLLGSGKASSYLKALEHLSRMIEYEPLGFEDCQDIFSVHSIKRLNELYEVTNEQKHLGRKSIWVVRGIPRSYLQNGYCTAAMRAYQEFLIQHAYESDLLERYEAFQGGAEELASRLERKLTVPKHLLENWQGQEGKETLRTIKARFNQNVFRRYTLENYQQRCCITDTPLPQLLTASHIKPWAISNAQEKLNPSNGLCLAKTQDAAFDKGLITLDETLRVVLSQSIRDHMTTESSEKTSFATKEWPSTSPPASNPRPISSNIIATRYSSRESTPNSLQLFMEIKVLLYMVGYGILFLAATVALAFVRKRFRTLRPPLEFEYNRLPGESLSKRIAKDNEKLFRHFILCLLTPIAAAMIVCAAFLIFYPTTTLFLFYSTLGIALLGALAIACWSLIDAAIANSKLELGLNGERIVADFLRPLEREGWRVFHDVPARENGKDFNLDHVAIGPTGVALIETKSRSKGKTIEGRKDHVVSYDGKQLVWPWGTSTSELEQLKRQQKWLVKWIHERTGITVPVSPILAIPGWWTETNAAGAFAKVTNHKNLCTAIKGYGQQTLDPQTIDLLSRQLESLCRIKA